MTAPVEGQLPLHTIERIVREAAGPGMHVAGPAVRCMRDCASEFVLFVAQEAAERCASQSRRTLQSDDVVAALSALGLSAFQPSQQ